MVSNISGKGVGRRLTALIVDDDRDAREMYTYFLAAVGVNTVEADDGLSGFAKAASMVPDVIALDLRLPRIDGVQLCRSLKANEETRAIPIIAVTGCASDGEIEAAKKAGCVSVLTKPCLPERLLDEIERVLARPPRV